MDQKNWKDKVISALTIITGVLTIALIVVGFMAIRLHKEDDKEPLTVGIQSTYIDEQSEIERVMTCTLKTETELYTIESENSYTYAGDIPSVKHEMVRVYSGDEELLQKMLDSFNEKVSTVYDVVGGITTDSTHVFGENDPKVLYLDTYITYNSLDLEKFKELTPSVVNLINENGQFSMLKIQLANEADGYICTMKEREPVAE